MWTSDFPKEQGYYWVKLNYGGVSIEYFYFNEYEPYNLLVGDAFEEQCDAIKLYGPYEPMFYGPLEKPE